jgi:exopolyphosphatase/guanosine-5'-triphosphate,3'-diphosphate pyrophosphatase
MLIADTLGPTSYKTVACEKMMIQLGKTSLVTGQLDSEAMDRGMKCLNAFRRIAMARRVERIYAVATSAIREAENGEEFIRRAGTESGIVVRTISAKEEARLVHLAVSRHIDIGSRKALIFDIGGGSVEFVVGNAHQTFAIASLKLGFLRMHGQFVTQDPMSRREERAMAEYYGHLLQTGMREINRHKPELVIATSGSATSLLRIMQKRRSETPGSQVPSMNISRAEISSVLKEMKQLKSIERAKRFDLDPMRSEYLPTALLCFNAVLKEAGSKGLTVCQAALREGLIYDTLAHSKPKTLGQDPRADIRRQAVIDMAKRCDYPAEHSHRVELLANQIFKQTSHLHGLGETEGKLLQCAAILHDIGYHIGYREHHKHGYYLVMNGDLRGFAPEERAMLALLVRYHRRAPPRNSHPEFAALPLKSRRLIKCLASILRIADGLDRSHLSHIHEVKCRSGRATMKFSLITDLKNSGIELDQWNAKRHARFFEKYFGIETKFIMVDEASSSPGARIKPHRARRESAQKKQTA